LEISMCDNPREPGYRLSEGIALSDIRACQTGDSDQQTVDKGLNLSTLNGYPFIFSAAIL